MSDDLITLHGDGITVAISAFGAEPHSIVDADDHEYLWQAGDEWKRRAPVLFPIICRVPEDTITVRGTSYPMPQHGFARDSMFQVVDVDYSCASFVLAATEETLQHYPYDFALSVRYEVGERTLKVDYGVENRGEVPMPFSLGWHPAFVWPLEPNARKSMHEIRFDQAEKASFRRVVDNLLTDETFDSLAPNRKLELRNSIFEDGAVIMTEVDSSSLVFDSSMGRGLHLEWDGFTGITVWTKPGADFLCVEPWRGYPAPENFDGDFIDKPGNAIIQPGSRENFSCQLQLI